MNELDEAEQIMQWRKDFKRAADATATVYEALGGPNNTINFLKDQIGIKITKGFFYELLAGSKVMPDNEDVRRTRESIEPLAEALKVLNLPDAIKAAKAVKKTSRSKKPPDDTNKPVL